MPGEFRAAVASIRRVAHALEPSCMTLEDAVTLLEDVLDGEKLLGGMKTRLVKRLEECRVGARDGHASTAEWLAQRSGTSVGRARDAVDTASRLRECPQTEQALRDGEISTDQASEISAGAAADPGAERSLLDAAQVDGVKGLRDKSRRVRHAAMSEEERVAREERIHRNRYHRRWTDNDGAGCGQYRLPPAAAARLWAELDAERDRIYKEARAEDRREGFGAYEADALCALGERDARSHRGTRVTAILHADISPLLRGETEPGDTCEIPGVGPVSLTAAQKLLGDAILRVVLSDGVAVRTVVHPNRTVAQVIRTALLWQHRECCVAGCHNVHGRQAHHTKPFAETRHTKLSELALPCTPHHHLVHHEGYRLEPRPDGQYDLVAPDQAKRGKEERGPPKAA
jgi:hypothetical protein